MNGGWERIGSARSGERRKRKEKGRTAEEKKRKKGKVGQGKIEKSENQ